MTSKTNRWHRLIEEDETGFLQYLDDRLYQKNKHYDPDFLPWPNHADEELGSTLKESPLPNLKNIEASENEDECYEKWLKTRIKKNNKQLQSVFREILDDWFIFQHRIGDKDQYYFEIVDEFSYYWLYKDFRKDLVDQLKHKGDPERQRKFLINVRKKLKQGDYNSLLSITITEVYDLKKQLGRLWKELLEYIAAEIEALDEILKTSTARSQPKKNDGYRLKFKRLILWKKGGIETLKEFIALLIEKGFIKSEFDISSDKENEVFINKHFRLDEVDTRAPFSGNMVSKLTPDDLIEWLLDPLELAYLMKQLSDKGFTAEYWKDKHKSKPGKWGIIDTHFGKDGRFPKDKLRDAWRTSFEEGKLLEPDAGSRIDEFMTEFESRCQKIT